ncbi:DUF305 domain-containing protein [Thioclava sp. GXIMD4216]|uniref:DUF305 domain-containing protein n=1 Tax=Thioclava litoralis TaxID=3076557 RepID=A0ABZ1E2Q3_9RHOB|nr:DUF305 domain-containing protein [Thioclava sp. FTW29]
MSRMTRIHKIAMLSPVAFALAFGAYAQDASYPQISKAAMATADASPSTAAFQQARARMARTLPHDYSGNVDLDFVRQMIPQKKSEIAMAEVVRDYGEDPAMRQRAAQLIKAQQDDLQWLEGWMAAHSNR